MRLDEMIAIVEKIDRGQWDMQTKEPRFSSLWQHPFLRESFLRLLHAYDSAHGVEFEQHNFENVCALIDPNFARILDSIDLLAVLRLDAPEFDSISYLGSRAS